MGQLCNDRSTVRVYNEETQRWDPVLEADGHTWVTRPCGAYAMKGFEKCVHHQAREEKRSGGHAVYKSRRLGKLLNQLDIPDTNPIDGLLEAVRYSGAMMRVLAVMVADLPAQPELVGDGMGGAVQLEPGMWGVDRFGEQAPHVLMKLYDQWMDRYTRSCKLAVEAGLDERMVRNAEFTSQVMVQAFNDALAKVPSLTPEQRQDLGMAMAQSVRQLGSGKSDAARQLG